MRPLLTFVVSSLLVAASIDPRRIDIEKDGYVVVLKNHTLDKFLSGFERVLINFHNITAFRLFDPEFQRATELGLSKGSKTHLARVDITREHVGEEYSTREWPPLGYFVHGKRVAHLKKTRAEDIHDWLMAQEFGLVERVARDDMEDFYRRIPLGHYGLLAIAKNGSGISKAFSRACVDNLKSFDAATFSCGIVYDRQAVDTSIATLSMWRPGFEAPDEPTITYSGKWTEKRIVAWAKANIYGKVSRIWNRNLWTEAQMDASATEGLVSAVIDDANLEEIVIKQLIEISTKNPSWKTMLYGSTLLEDSKEDASFLNPTSAPPPFVHVVDIRHQRRFVLQGSKKLADPRGVVDFLANVMSGKVKASRQTFDANDEYTDDDGVLNLVANNFDTYIDDPAIDVFVLYYTLECDACRTILPIWQKVGRRMKDKTGVKVAKMNVIDNEPDEPLQKVPKIVLYRAVPTKRKRLDRLVYTREPTYEGILSFLLDSAVNLDGEL